MAKGFFPVDKVTKEEMQRNQVTLPFNGGAVASPGNAAKSNFSGYRPASTTTTRKATGGGTSNQNAQYIKQMNDLYAQYMNRGPFQYDLNGDMLYRQMADKYTQMGQQAMMDTMGQAAALTGGYANSYAQNVGQQAYQQYLTALNDQVPSLYQQAYNVWQDEGDRLLQMYELAAAHPGNLAALQPRSSSGSSGVDEAYLQRLMNALNYSTPYGSPANSEQTNRALRETEVNALNNWYYQLLNR